MAIHSSYSYQHKTQQSASISVAQNQKTEETKNSGLSQKAQDYLDGLKKKYGNVEFTIADFNSDEEASELMKNGSKDYSCVISPDLLEKMAADESVAAEYEGIIASAGQQFETISEELGEDAEHVKNYGITVDGNGKVSYYAIMKETFDKVNEQTAKANDKKAEAKKADRKEEAHQKPKNIIIDSDSAKGLVASIKSYVASLGRKDSKDTFVIEPNNDKAWGSVNGKKDGFDPHEKNWSEQRKEMEKLWTESRAKREEQHNAHKSNNIDAKKPQDFWA